MKRKMRIIHPGEVLNEGIIKANGLTVTAASRYLGVTRTTLSNIVNGKSDISPEMCYRIAAVFGGAPEIWANLQTKYNLLSIADKAKTLHLLPYKPGKTA
jgi:addiction module HigA family antidote